MALGGIDHPLGTRMPLVMRMPYAQRMVHGGTVPDKSIRDAYAPLQYDRMFTYMFIYITCFVTKHQTCIKCSQAFIKVVR
jgi:hypothetical protein